MNGEYLRTRTPVKSELITIKILMWLSLLLFTGHKIKWLQLGIFKNIRKETNISGCDNIISIWALISVKTKKAWVDIRNLIRGYGSFKKPQEFDIDTCRTIVAPLGQSYRYHSTHHFYGCIIYLTYFLINVPARYSVRACCVKFVNLQSSGGHDLQSHWGIFYIYRGTLWMKQSQGLCIVIYMKTFWNNRIKI